MSGRNIRLGGILLSLVKLQCLLTNYKEIIKSVPTFYRV